MTKEDVQKMAVALATIAECLNIARSHYGWMPELDKAYGKVTEMRKVLREYK
jgi:hypothetical protein